MLEDKLSSVKLNPEFDGVGEFYKYVENGSLLTWYTVKFIILQRKQESLIELISAARYEQWG